MTDPIELLQQDVSNPHVSVVSLLQKALPLAQIKQDDAFVAWATRELKGYAEAVAGVDYRNLKGEYLLLKADGRPIPIHWKKDDPKMKSRFITLPLAEIESLASRTGDTFAVKINVAVSELSFYESEPGDAVCFSLSRATVCGFLSAVRQRVLDWTMSFPPSQSSKGHSTMIEASRATVFYSWQSDLPNKTNRGFIEDCLERAIKDLRAEGELRVDPCIDRDTINVPGSPDIAATIFDKIESCGLFVCDVSIINKGAPGRLTPNPNVLIELGFAVKTLGWNRVVCILNQSTGAVEDLPFDLRHRRVRCYRLADGEEKAEARKLLTGLLKSDLGSAFSFVEPESETARQSTSAESTRAPRVEILDATLECQPPIAAPSQPHVHHIRPEYVEGKLVWSVTASLFLDTRPGEPLTIAFHRCAASMEDRYSGKAIPLTNLTFISASASQISVDDAVMSIRGPGKFSFQAVCETPFRQAGYPDIVKIELRLPISELQGDGIKVTLELHEAHQGNGWPLRWKHRSEIKA